MKIEVDSLFLVLNLKKNNNEYLFQINPFFDRPD